MCVWRCVGGDSCAIAVQLPCKIWGDPARPRRIWVESIPHTMSAIEEAVVAAAEAAVNAAIEATASSGDAFGER